MTDVVLSAQGLSRRFDAVVANDAVSLALEADEIHALIGPNGAGKSTLIKLLSGALRADAGEVFLDGREISRLGVVERARQGIARSFQVSSVAGEFTALQNIMLADIGRSRGSFKLFDRVARDSGIIERAHEVLRRVSLDDRADTEAARLSHGERRALELGMALALAPRVLLLDEPMAGMGAAYSQQMTALLADMKRTAPILLVEHDMDAVFALADRVSVLVYGRLIITGTVDEIRRDPEVRKAYMGDDSE